MNDPVTGPASRGQLMAMLNAYQLPGAILAGIELDLFTAVGAGANNTGTLAVRCGASERGVRILADALCVFGLLDKSEGRYALLPLATELLDRASPDYLGDIARFMLAPAPLARFLERPADWVRRGGSADLAHTTPEDPVWVTFARTMGRFMAPVATAMAGMILARAPRVERVLDIAAGHGRFGLALAQTYPGAVITAVDWPAVLAVARENAELLGVGERLRLLPGDAFEIPLGENYDLILVTNFLHHFDRQACVGFLRKCRAALAPGGLVAILEFVPDENRIGPPGPALFALTMLAQTPAGDAYTAAELAGMCHEAGLQTPYVAPVPNSEETLLLAGL